MVSRIPEGGPRVQHIHVNIDGREAAMAIVRSGGDVLARSVDRHVRRAEALR